MELLRTPFGSGNWRLQALALSSANNLLSLNSGVFLLTCGFPDPQSLDDVIKDLMAAIHRELAEKQSLSFSTSFPPNKLEFTATKADGTESYIFEFPNPDARHNFEQAFDDTKKKLGNCVVQR